ncbi:MAG: hypothetical protein ACRYFS_11950 [Janthinobacterium lividum]
MPVSYRKPPKMLEDGAVAYLDVFRLDGDDTFYGAILMLDGRGLPLEFVHNRLPSPSGLLWTEPDTGRQAVAALAHSLFDACRRDPDLLLCLPSLGTAEFCRAEIAPASPFAQVLPASESLPTGILWVNAPPTDGMRGLTLYQEALRRDALVEPFARLRLGLREIYPQAPWPVPEKLEAARVEIFTE